MLSFITVAWNGMRHETKWNAIKISYQIINNYWKINMKYLFTCMQYSISGRDLVLIYCINLLFKTWKHDIMIIENNWVLPERKIRVSVVHKSRIRFWQTPNPWPRVSDVIKILILRQFPTFNNTFNFPLAQVVRSKTKSTGEFRVLLFGHG